MNAVHEPPTLLEVIADPGRHVAGTIPAWTTSEFPDPGPLLQDRYWTDTAGLIHDLEQMTPAARSEAMGRLYTQSETWLQAATDATTQHVKSGRISEHEFQRRTVLLRTAPRSWILTAPLMRRLRALNERPHATTNPTDTGPHTLRDSERGHAEVTTLTAGYTLDLTARQFRRNLGIGRALVRSADGTFGHRRRSEIDAEWQPLLEVIQCTVGLPFIVRCRPDPQEAPLVATTVQRIEWRNQREGRLHPRQPPRPRRQNR